jgi:hypothetical protein
VSKPERALIFLTFEGYTYQPGSESAMPDVENVQMLGIASGQHASAAFGRLAAENLWLRDTSFDEVYCYELARDFAASRAEFSLDAAYHRQGAQT